VEQQQYFIGREEAHAESRGEQLGFPTLGSFSKYFKRLTGLSPKDFRSQSR